VSEVLQKEQALPCGRLPAEGLLEIDYRSPVEESCFAVIIQAHKEACRCVWLKKKGVAQAIEVKEDVATVTSFGLEQQGTGSN